MPIKSPPQNEINYQRAPRSTVDPGWDVVGVARAHPGAGSRGPRPRWL